jgi:hypothetical protein
MSQLLVNSIQTPDGTILKSRSSHDFVGHTDTISGEYYFTDGGILYFRRTVNKVPFVSLDVWTTDPHEKIRDSFEWGSYGVNGDQPLKYTLLKDLDVSHIVAIVLNQKLALRIKTMLENELCFRAGTPLNLYEPVLY